jgi:hypothetical protein
MAAPLKRGEEKCVRFSAGIQRLNLLSITVVILGRTDLKSS